MEDKILMVEDSTDVLHLNRIVLERRGYAVCAAETLREARRLLEQHLDIAVAVLDILLPDGDGLAFAGEVREKIGCPVLMLTSKGEHDDVVKGLGIADGYLIKPYRIDELTAHVQALIERRRAAENSGPLVLDLSGRATLHGEDLMLQPREFAVLVCLYRNEGRFVSTRTVYESVWPQPLQDDSSAVKSTVARLRKKLEGSSYVIDTKRGDGIACGGG